MKRGWFLLSLTILVIAGCKSSVEEANKHLLKACNEENVQGAKDALAEGADPNIIEKHDGQDYTVLEASVDSPEMVRALLKAGAKPNKADKGGFYALGMAAGAGSKEAVEALIAGGANVNAKDKGGLTALAYAAASGKVENAKTLLDHGANVNHADKYGLTPLFQLVMGATASPEERLGMAKLLIAHGADTKIKDKTGRTAVGFAKHRFDKPTGATAELIKLLAGEGGSPAGA